nr:dirigent protein 12 [Phryma leptostachya subsp. asiatica]
MGKAITILMVFSMVLAHAAGSPSLTEISQSLDRWFKSLNQEKATLTKLQVYIQATFAKSKDQTVFEVASSEITSQSPTNFGRIIVIDNGLTIGTDPDSQSLGRYQGMNTYADFKDTATNMNMNIIFSGGDYDGSTISVMGRQPIMQEVRVLTVIGGSGAFRFAKGIVLASTISTDAKKQTGTYVYVMYVVTPAAGGVRVA